MITEKTRFKQSLGLFGIIGKSSFSRTTYFNSEGKVLRIVEIRGDKRTTTEFLSAAAKDSVHIQPASSIPEY